MKSSSTLAVYIIFISLFSSNIWAQSLNLNSFKKAISTVSTPTNSSSLSKEEITKGLKNALTIGSSKASDNLHKTDGFLKDAAIKILLPAEAQAIARNIRLIPGGEKLVNDVVLRMNRAAEDAAITAKPIFINAISDISITDAWNILHGPNDAATQYLNRNTNTSLKQAFQPKINESLNKKLIADISAAEAWNKLMRANNKAARSYAGKLAGMKRVNANLSEHVTNKALNGIFIKLADEEKQIRKNPSARINDILKKVFAELDK